MIKLTKHAEEKFGVLKRHKFLITRAQVFTTIIDPEIIDRSRSPLLIAQRKIDKTHVLRVVYRKEGATIVVITFYPGRVSQYEE